MIIPLDSAMLGAIIAVVALIAAIGWKFINILLEFMNRIAAVETNVKLLLNWVACLNGELSTKKDYEEFMKKLREVTKENDCLWNECKDDI